MLAIVDQINHRLTLIRGGERSPKNLARKKASCTAGLGLRDPLKRWDTAVLLVSPPLPPSLSQG